MYVWVRWLGPGRFFLVLDTRAPDYAVKPYAVYQVQLYAVPHRHVALTQAHSSTQTELELSVPCLPQHLTKNVTRSTA